MVISVSSLWIVKGQGARVGPRGVYKLKINSKLKITCAEARLGSNPSPDTYFEYHGTHQSPITQLVRVSGC